MCVIDPPHGEDQFNLTPKCVVGGKPEFPEKNPQSTGEIYYDNRSLA